LTRGPFVFFEESEELGGDVSVLSEEVSVETNYLSEDILFELARCLWWLDIFAHDAQVGHNPLIHQTQEGFQAN